MVKTNSNLAISRRKILVGAGIITVQSTIARAQTGWPARSIRIVVPSPAGAGSDLFARILIGPLSESLRQSVVVDNRPGANGLIAVDS